MTLIIGEYIESSQREDQAKNASGEKVEQDRNCLAAKTRALVQVSSQLSIDCRIRVHQVIGQQVSDCGRYGKAVARLDNGQ